MHEIIRYGAPPRTPPETPTEPKPFPVRFDGPPPPTDDVAAAIKRLVALRLSPEVTLKGRAELDAVIGMLHVASMPR